MGTLRRLQPVAAALLLASLLSACASLASTRRLILRGHKPINASSPALKSAGADDLNAIIARTYDGIHSFAATVTLAASAGNVYQGRIVDYPSLSGQILFSKPNE